MPNMFVFITIHAKLKSVFGLDPQYYDKKLTLKSTKSVD